MFTKEAIHNMIPHHGEMHLLDEVIMHDENEIHCQSRSHTHHKNPLRFENKLSAVCGIEYAGQAVALHRYLIANTKSDKPKSGYLAALKNVEVYVDEISSLSESLDIKAKCIFSENSKACYEFVVSHQDDLIIKGNMIVAEGV